ncbi:hypothetical protein MJ581_07250 [Escherichia coli]|nr:hypothetical protein MJ581_07250 [Escherichia coli]
MQKSVAVKGVIRDDFDPAFTCAAIYKHYASAISVLTDEIFSGGFDFLPIVVNRPQPILCELHYRSLQIYLARYYRADACLLMLSVLDDEQYRQLAAVAHSLEMGVLTEVSNEEDLEACHCIGGKGRWHQLTAICVICRLISTRTRELAPKLGHNVTVISESGINTCSSRCAS